MAYCNNCGKPLAESDKYCPNCGRRIGPARLRRSSEGVAANRPSADARRKAANLRRRIAMLKYHESMRGLDGKSISAQRGGRAAMQKRAAAAGSVQIVAMEMALKRWYPEADAPHKPRSSRKSTD